VAGFFNVRLPGAYGLEHRKQANACLQVLCEGQWPELAEPIGRRLILPPQPKRQTPPLAGFVVLVLGQKPNELNPLRSAECVPRGQGGKKHKWLVCGQRHFRCLGKS